MGRAKAASAKLDHWSDAELLARVKERHPAVEEWRAVAEELLMRHRGLMVACARRVLHRNDEILDVVQEASMKATRAMHTCDGNVKAWLSKIVTNEALNIVRAHHSSRHEAVDASAVVGNEPEPIEKIVNDEDQSWTAKGIEFLIECTYAVVERLPEKQKMAFKLRYKDRLSPQEIADKLQTSIEAIYMLQRRAKLSLGIELAEVILGYMGEAS